MGFRLALVSLLVPVTAFVVGCRERGDAAHEHTRASPSPITPEDVPLPRGGRPEDIAFWKWFGSSSADLAKDPSLEHVMETIQQRLDKAHRGVLAEIGQAKDRRKLVLTADGERKLFPMTKRLWVERPTVSGWATVAFRERDPRRPLLRITIGDRKLESEAMRYRVDTNDKQLDIELFVPGYVEGDKRLGLMASIALDHAVGEYDVETKLAGINLQPIELADATARPLGELPAQIDALSGR